MQRRAINFVLGFLALFTMPAGTVGIAASVNQPDGTEMTAQDFLAAAEADDIARLQRGLEQGIPIDSRDANGRTALLLATHANAIKAARLLIDHGADVDAKDDIEDSPYLYAGAEGRLEILMMTIAAGADLTSVNRYGGTALTPAAHHGHVEVVRYLLTTDVDVDHINDLGWTALLEAVILGDGGAVYREIVALLLENGADPAIGDRQGVTALDHARTRGQTEIIELLEQATARGE